MGSIGAYNKCTDALVQKKYTGVRADILNPENGSNLPHATKVFSLLFESPQGRFCSFPVLVTTLEVKENLFGGHRQQ